MKFSRVATSLLSIVVLLFAGAVHADLTIVQKLTFDLSKLSIMGQPVTESQMQMINKSPMFQGGGMDITMVSAGKKLKVDSPMASTIVDADAKTQTVLYPSKRQYTVNSIQADSLKQLGEDTTSTVIDMNRSATILGHSARLFKFEVKNTMMTVSGSAWLATDIPMLPQFAGVNPVFDMIRSKLAGLPLKLNATASTAMLFDNASFAVDVTSISANPVPSPVFAIPDGYTQTATAPSMGLGGF